jgi:hypothetical protein
MAELPGFEGTCLLMDRHERPVDTSSYERPYFEFKIRGFYEREECGQMEPKKEERELSLLSAGYI